MDIPSVLLIFFILLVPATVILVPRWMRWRERQRILDALIDNAICEYCRGCWLGKAQDVSRER